MTDRGTERGAPTVSNRVDRSLRYYFTSGSVIGYL
jgi:hypothetical protein